MPGENQKTIEWKNMDASKQNKFAMAQASNAVLIKKVYKPLWSGTPGFVRLQADLTAQIKTITDLSITQGRRKTGVADDKDAARQAMCKAANIVAGAVASYAHSVGNHELLTRVDTTPSILLGGRGKDSRDKCADILAAATANLAALRITPSPSPTLMICSNSSPTSTNSQRPRNWRLARPKARGRRWTRRLTRLTAS